MWLLVFILAVLGTVVLCSCVECMNDAYLQLLEHIFAYTARQLQAAQRQKRNTPRKRANSHQTLSPPSPPSPPSSPPLKASELKAQQQDALNARMEQCCSVLADGLRLVLEDEVTTRFAAAAPPPGEWNLLTRNLRQRLRHLNWQLCALWLLGIVLRYALLVPLRTLGCASCLLLLTLVTFVLGHLPEWRFKRRLVRCALRSCFRLGMMCIPVVRRVHNVQQRPRMGICVCNHTSPLDVLVLMCDVHYSLTGQRHDGILGLIQRALARASPHLWFERRALGERESLGLVLRLHATGCGRPPILLFPEGTCINNTAVMQFKKGSFAICNVVYPVALLYDRRFGDAFWDSTRCSMMRYILLVISSWSIKCDIWYMPAVKRRLNETPIEFANRAKAVIAAQAGIEDLPWDGNLKRWNPVRDW